MWEKYSFSFGILTKKIVINQFTKNSSFKVYENFVIALYFLKSSNLWHIFVETKNMFLTKEKNVFQQNQINRREQS